MRVLRCYSLSGTNAGYRFSCAYRQHYGGVSCSEAVKRLLEAHGLIAASPAIQRRFQACRQAAKLTHQKPAAMALDIGCDCAPDACTPDISTADSSGECLIPSTCRFPRVLATPLLRSVYFMLWLSLAIWLGILSMRYSEQIHTIVLTSQAEITEPADAFGLGAGRLPDYRIDLLIQAQALDNLEWRKSTTASNQSASNGIRFIVQPTIALYALKSIRLVEDDKLQDDVMEVLTVENLDFSSPRYHYQLQTRQDYWAGFKQGVLQTLGGVLSLAGLFFLSVLVVYIWLDTRRQKKT